MTTSFQSGLTREAEPAVDRGHEERPDQPAGDRSRAAGDRRSPDDRGGDHLEFKAFAEAGVTALSICEGQRAGESGKTAGEHQAVGAQAVRRDAGEHCRGTIGSGRADHRPQPAFGEQHGEHHHQPQGDPADDR